jgi:ankyrin repeat protein
MPYTRLIHLPSMYHCIVIFIFSIILTSCGMPEKTKKLYDAIDKGDYNEVKRLVENGADVNASTKGKVTYSPLHRTVLFRKDMEISKILVQNGAKVNARNNLGRTPLYHAARAGQKEMVAFLLSNGANPKIKDNHGVTP